MTREEAEHHTRNYLAENRIWKSYYVVRQFREDPFLMDAYAARAFGLQLVIIHVEPDDSYVKWFNDYSEEEFTTFMAHRLISGDIRYV